MSKFAALIKDNSLDAKYHSMVQELAMTLEQIINNEGY